MNFGPQPTDNDVFSRTNNQEFNIDEADLVKSDGNYIYIALNNKLYIVLGYHPTNFNFQIVSQIAYDPAFRP